MAVNFVSGDGDEAERVGVVSHRGPALLIDICSSTDHVSSFPSVGSTLCFMSIWLSMLLQHRS